MKAHFILLSISLWMISNVYSQNVSSKDITITSGSTTYNFKQSTLCDNVIQYSGFINVTPTTKYFFWFFESRQDPTNAPVTIWLNGGPGCSSQTGLWQEVGPCQTNDDGSQALYNERGSWNKITNMLFLDQPAGTGYSVGDPIDTTETATKLVYQFLLNFFDAFSQYRNNKFYFFGESYAGHYIPSMASYIINQNNLLQPGDTKRINLQMVGIGDGLTSVVIQDQYVQKMACDSTYGAVLDKDNCDLMARNQPNCINLLKICQSNPTVSNCVNATEYCATNLEYIYLKSGRNIYDVRSTKGPGYNYLKFIERPSVKQMIGVPSDQNFVRCNSKVKEAFYATGDYAKDFAPFVGQILDNNIPVLIFAGDADYRGNWYGNYAWTQQLSFKNNQAYQSSSFKPFVLTNGTQVGEVQTGGGLTFVKIYQAGHMAAYYQPEAVYEMFDKFTGAGF